MRVSNIICGHNNIICFAIDVPAFFLCVLHAHACPYQLGDLKWRNSPTVAHSTQARGRIVVFGDQSRLPVCLSSRIETLNSGTVVLSIFSTISTKTSPKS